MTTPEWRSMKRPSHLTTRQPRNKSKREPADISLNQVLWMALLLMIPVFLILT